MACRRLASGTNDQRGFTRFTKCLGFPTTRPETTSRRRIDWGWTIPLEHDPFSGSFHCWIGNRDRRKKRLRMWMSWMVVNGILCTNLHNLSQVHHRHLVGDMSNNGKIMGDKHIRHTKSLLQIAKEVDNACLNAHIERRNRLVKNNQIGFKC